MNSKHKLFVVIGVLVIIVGFIIGLFVIHNRNSISTQIEIQKLDNVSGTKIKQYTLSQEETHIMQNIMENLTFYNPTCDGIINYIIKYNTKEGLVSYGMEVYGDSIHIHTDRSGEARLTTEEVEQLYKIINNLDT